MGLASGFHPGHALAPEAGLEERGQARLKGRWGGNAEEREGLRKSMIRDRREQHRKRRESARLGVLFIHVSARWC